jgi:hypothetical protein
MPTNPTPIPDKRTFLKTLLTAYYRQQQVEPFDYVNLYSVADIFCRETGYSLEQFSVMLGRFFGELIAAGYHIALETDGTPSQRAAIQRRKPKNKIVVNGYSMSIISMRE